MLVLQKSLYSTILLIKNSLQMAISCIMYADLGVRMRVPLLDSLHGARSYWTLQWIVGSTGGGDGTERVWSDEIHDALLLCHIPLTQEDRGVRSIQEDTVVACASHLSWRSGYRPEEEEDWREEEVQFVSVLFDASFRPSHALYHSRSVSTSWTKLMCNTSIRIPFLVADQVLHYHPSKTLLVLKQWLEFCCHECLQDPMVFYHALICCIAVLYP
jgi:hypothetical protein